MLLRNCAPFLKYYLLILKAFGFIGIVKGGYDFREVEVLKCPPSIAVPPMYETVEDGKMCALCLLFEVRSLERGLLTPQDRFDVY